MRAGNIQVRIAWLNLFKKRKFVSGRKYRNRNSVSNLCSKKNKKTGTRKTDIKGRRHDKGYESQEVIGKRTAKNKN